MKRIPLWSGVVILLLPGALQGAFVQNAPTTIPAMHIEGLGVPEVLRKAAEQANVQIGLEADVIYGKEKRESLDFHGGTIVQFAEECAALLEGASWKISSGNGILLSRPSKAAKVGQTNINYPGISNATRKQVWYSLLHQPVLEQALASSSCTRLDGFWGSEWKGDQPTISISPGARSLQEIMQITLAQSDRHYWNILNNIRNGQCEVIIQAW